MKRTLNTIVSIALLSLFPALFLYQGAQGQINTEEQAVRLATDFLKNSPTYRFDGIDDSIELISVNKSKSPNTWDITLKFTTRHSGYGDREGQLLLQVITEHTMVIEVMEGEVASAITDGKFDEIQESFIDNSDIIDKAEELSFEWLRNAPTFNFDGIESTMQVLQSSTTLDPILGDNQIVKYIIIIGFDCAHAGYGDRSGMMMAQVVTEHKAAITIVNNQIQSAIIVSSGTSSTRWRNKYAIYYPLKRSSVLPLNI
ncbi:hypothetical protein GF319_14640 [Candidatus Bathyarchaeota archaeon]|nr:hypothetical protein [Candidatus Bathyarchaeota archaeon]